MAEHKFPMEGVEVWQNDKNKFLIFQLHYTADPEKRDGEYRDSIKNSMPIRKYLQEYELNWESFVGLPVYGDWDKTKHISTEKIQAHLGSPLLIGFDFGLTPACIIAQLRGDTLFVLKEFVEFNKTVESFGDMVVSQLKILYPEWGDLSRDILCFVDPSGASRKDTDGSTCTMILNSKGFRAIPSEITWEARKSSVEHFLTRSINKIPCLQVDASNCPMLIRGFEGGYMYSEGSDTVEPGKIRPIKNEFSHVHDAFQYLCAGMLKKVKQFKAATIPVPKYTISEKNKKIGQLKQFKRG